MIRSETLAPFRMLDVATAVRDGDHVAWLGDVLRVIAVEALGGDELEVLEGPDWERLIELIGGPVTDAAEAAIERLALELAIAVERHIPASSGCTLIERHHAELGLD
jgi:hypothetical protein